MDRENKQIKCKQSLELWNILADIEQSLGSESTMLLSGGCLNTPKNIKDISLFEANRMKDRIIQKHNNNKADNK